MSVKHSPVQDLLFLPFPGSLAHLFLDLEALSPVHPSRGLESLFSTIEKTLKGSGVQAFGALEHSRSVVEGAIDSQWVPDVYVIRKRRHDVYVD